MPEMKQKMTLKSLDSDIFKFNFGNIMLIVIEKVIETREYNELILRNS